MHSDLLQAPADRPHALPIHYYLGAPARHPTAALH